MVHGAWCMVHGAWCMVHGVKKGKITLFHILSQETLITN
jgi:hypothetical protein